MQVRVERNEIRTEQAGEQFLPRGKMLKISEPGNGMCQEESDRCVREALTEHARQEHQVVIMNPYPIARLKLMHDCGTEPAIRFDVRFPVFGIELQFGSKAVKQRLECLVGVALIEFS